ncbi:hypothetical protein MCOR02_003750 [Pyricularia oryzae]|nr:hypothetical protein MCOR01_005585 [Pyricularia oryzae]KAH9434787.1 hypothetical protein MCOR02_003750 [Pyricularia oryzae]KAI6261242.1 hypothetical protein MCOR19_002541 [Pyricularia oryzae]KAI6267233.1 hypothetical protein MCOR26_009805 [Pyricularia oryzae]KAI6310378.1 hypothetical protein MCOR30_011139 [Pyricularia oryzae]
MASPLEINMAGRVFAITGGASGIGLATAELLARHGAAAIWIADMQTSVFETVQKHLSDLSKDTEVHLEKVDVSDSAQVEQWVERIIAKSGVLHGAVNSAGVSYPFDSLFQEEPVILREGSELWRRVVNINLEGTVHCTRAQVRAMLKMEKGSNPAIVNVSSAAAINHQVGAVAYSASKASVSHFTTAMGNDLAAHGLRVNAVLPGAVYTPMLESSLGLKAPEKTDDPTAAPRCIYPVDVARAIVWLLSENSLCVNGINLPVGGLQP